jgi:hypothetical protein
MLVGSSSGFARTARHRPRVSTTRWKGMVGPDTSIARSAGISPQLGQAATSDPGSVAPDRREFLLAEPMPARPEDPVRQNRKPKTVNRAWEPT